MTQAQLPLRLTSRGRHGSVRQAAFVYVLEKKKTEENDIRWVIRLFLVVITL